MTPRDVFISYAGFDRESEAALAEAFEAAKVAMWWDAELAVDQPFEEQIQRILAGTKLIVAILSPLSLASEWVRWEVSQACLGGLHIVPLLVNGARSDQLPPPLHLLPSLTISVEGDGAALMRDVAIKIRELVRTINRSVGRQKENDARRRLASAAARTARQAADIKYRKGLKTPQPPIVVTGREHEPEADQGPPAMQYTMSDGLVAFLHDQNIAIAFTSETGELFLLGRAASGRLMVNIQPFRKPTGLYAAGDSLLVATLSHVHRMENILRPDQRMDATFSHCYLPRMGYFTGDLDTHEVGMTGAGEIFFVATRFNCLASISPVHSFTPVWRPSFISELVAEDRCHLNGLAMRNGAPAYLTAIGRSNTYDGWRDQLASGGIVLGVQADEFVCEGLSMPHSPRVHDDRLWVLNSGAGELGFVDLSMTAIDQRYQPIAFCPGFVRGLAFHGRYACVGLSRPRYDDFAGLALQQRLRDVNEEAWCGIQIVDTRSGRCLHWFRISGPAREIYNVAVLPQVLCPRSLSDMNDEAIDLITIEERVRED